MADTRNQAWRGMGCSISGAGKRSEVSSHFLAYLHFLEILSIFEQIQAGYQSKHYPFSSVHCADQTLEIR